MYKKDFRYFLITRSTQISPKLFIQELSEWLAPNQPGLTVFNQAELTQIMRILLLMDRYDYLLVMTSILQLPTDPHCLHFLPLEKLQLLYREIKKFPVIFNQIDFFKWPASPKSLSTIINDACLSTSAKRAFNLVEENLSLDDASDISAAVIFTNKQSRMNLLSSTTDPILLALINKNIDDDSKRALLMNRKLVTTHRDFFLKSLSNSSLICAIPNDFINTHLEQHWSATNIQFFYQHGWQPGNLFASLIHTNIRKARELLSFLPKQVQADLFTFTFYTYGSPIRDLLPNLFYNNLLYQLLLPEQQLEITLLQLTRKAATKTQITHPLVFRKIFSYLPDHFRQQANVHLLLENAAVISEKLENLSLTHQQNFFSLIDKLRNMRRNKIFNLMISMNFITSGFAVYSFYVLTYDSLANESLEKTFFAMIKFLIAFGVFFIVTLSTMMTLSCAVESLDSNQFTSNEVQGRLTELSKTRDQLEIILLHLESLPEMQTKNEMILHQLQCLKKEKAMITFFGQYRAGARFFELVTLLQNEPFYIKDSTPPYIIHRRQMSRFFDLKKLFFGLQEYTLTTLHSNKATSDSLSPYSKHKEISGEFGFFGRQILNYRRTHSPDDDNDLVFRMV